MQFLKKPCIVVQVSIESYFNSHDHNFCCFHLNQPRMSIVDQLWNIFVLSRETNCTKMCNFCIDSEFKLNALFFHLLIMHCLCDCIADSWFNWNVDIFTAIMKMWKIVVP